MSCANLVAVVAARLSGNGLAESVGAGGGLGQVEEGIEGASEAVGSRRGEAQSCEEEASGEPSAESHCHICSASGGGPLKWRADAPLFQAWLPAAAE